MPTPFHRSRARSQWRRRMRGLLVGLTSLTLVFTGTASLATSQVEPPDVAEILKQAVGDSPGSEDVMDTAAEQQAEEAVAGGATVAGVATEEDADEGDITEDGETGDDETAAGTAGGEQAVDVVPVQHAEGAERPDHGGPVRAFRRSGSGPPPCEGGHAHGGERDVV